jgi:glutathione S-transferase
VRACLRWKNIPYTELLSDAKAHEELIIRRGDFRAIPVMVSPDDETLQDSTDIIYIFVRH